MSEPPDQFVEYERDFELFVTDPGANLQEVYLLYREFLGLNPAATRQLLGLPRVWVASGWRARIEEIVRKFRNAGALVEVHRATSDDS